MRVLVCGSRTFSDWLFVKHKVGALYEIFYDSMTIVSGGARGADHCAERAAKDYGIDIEVFKANWNDFGRAAGPIRNQEMLDSGVDLGYAFVDKPLADSRGTADMIGRLRAEGIPVAIFEGIDNGYTIFH